MMKMMNSTWMLFFLSLALFSIEEPGGHSRTQRFNIDCKPVDVLGHAYDGRLPVKIFHRVASIHCTFMVSI